MMKTHLIVSAFAVAVASSALAQNAPTAQGGQSSAPQTTASSQAPVGPTALQPNQLRASKLIGLDVYGFDQGNRNDREKIGDISELIVDRNGNIEAVVVGVGGFLGIGEKHVAIPFKSVELRFGNPEARTAANTNAPARSEGTVATRTDGPSSTASTSPTGGPAQGMSTGSVARSGGSDGDTGVPDRGYIRLSKADLQNAPEFRFGGSDGSRGSPAGTQSAPRQ